MPSHFHAAGGVGDELSDAAAIGPERRAAMEGSHAVDEKRPRGRDDLALVVIDLRPLVAGIVGWPAQRLPVVLPGTHRGGREVRSHLRVVEEVGRLPVIGKVRRIGERVVGEIAVHGLVPVQIRPLVLGMQMRLFAVDVLMADVFRGEAAQFRMHGDGVQAVAPVGKHRTRSFPSRREHGRRLRRILAILHPAG